MNGNQAENLNFEILGYLGSGTFAQVKKAKYKDQIVAVKIFHPHKQNDLKNEFMKEVNELIRISHPNIIKLIAFGKCLDKSDVTNCMIIEFADTGSLHHVLHDTDYNYTFGHCISWMYQCSDAINYLHSQTPKPIIHRDLKPLNLLLMEGGTIIKVCDFGTARNVSTIMTHDIGSPCWIAPEQLDDVKYKTYNEKCDVYSYSIIAWEIMARLTPYFHINDANAAKIMFGVSRGTLRPKKISNCPKVLELLLERGMDGEPNKRPSMTLIFNIMKKINSLINKTPVKPIVPNCDAAVNSQQNQSNFLTTPQLTITKNDATNDNTIIEPNQFTFTDLKPITNRNKNLSHKRSKSDGNSLVGPIIKNIEDEKTIILKELYNRIETMLYDPLEPILNNDSSVQIYNEHLSLIKEDNDLQQKINALRIQRDQLDQTIRDINSYNELLKQRNLLVQENSKLKNAIRK